MSRISAPLPMHMPATRAGLVPVSGLGDDEIMVDNFAGGGGASTGLKWTTGRDPDVALNHDAPACAMYRANHPATKVLNQSVTALAPIDTVMLGSQHRAERLERVWDGRPMRVGLAWFSPDCTDHSKAKGGAPIRNRASRDLAWVIILWAKLPPAIRPRIIMMENVEEWLDWAPLRQRVWPEGTELAGQPMLDLHGNAVLERDPEKKGAIFRKWLRQLKRLGYTVSYRKLRASRYGAPTIRQRLFLIARCDGHPILWPAETHGPDLTPMRTAAECIDWSIPCPSIFDRKKPLAEPTMRRIARGVKRYVIEAAKPFIVGLAHGTHTERPGARSHGLDDQFRTIHAGGGNHALVVPSIVSITHTSAKGGDDRVHGVEEQFRTITTAKRGEHALVAAHLQRQFGKSIGSAMRSPVGAVTAGGGGKTALVAAFMAQHNGGPKNDKAPLSRPVDAPISSIVTRGTQQQLVAAALSHQYSSNTAGGEGSPAMPIKTITTGGHAALVAAFLEKYYSAGGQDASLEEGMHTLTAKARMGLVTVTIDGETYVIVDIGMRMLTPRELFNAQGFNDNYVIEVMLEGDLLDADRHARLADGKRGRRKPSLTKEEQIRMCGNSVPPPMSMVLSAANLNLPPAMPFGKMREAA